MLWVSRNRKPTTTKKGQRHLFGLYKVFISRESNHKKMVNRRLNTEGRLLIAAELAETETGGQTGGSDWHLLDLSFASFGLLLVGSLLEEYSRYSRYSLF